MSNFVVDPYRFVVSEPCQETTITEHRQRYTAYGNGWAGGVQFKNEHCTVGDLATNVTFNLLRIGSPTGTAYARVYSDTGGGGTIRCTLGSIDVSTISTSATDYTFNSPDTSYTVVNNDIFAIYFNGGDASNKISFGMNQSDAGSFPDNPLGRYPSGSWDFNDQSTMYYIIN